MRDGATLQEMGDALGVTRERARQLERLALLKLRRLLLAAELRSLSPRFHLM